MRFSLADLEALQRLAFPLLYTVAGIDVQGAVSKQADTLKAAGDGFTQLADLFYVAGEAAADGILSGDEINALVEKAQDLPEAIDLIEAAFSDAD